MAEVVCMEYGLTRTAIKEGEEEQKSVREFALFKTPTDGP